MSAFFATDKRGHRVNLAFIVDGHYTGNSEWTGWDANGKSYKFTHDPTSHANYVVSDCREAVAFAHDEGGMFEFKLDCIGWAIDESFEFPTPIFADGSTESGILIAIRFGERWLFEQTYYDDLDAVRRTAQKRTDTRRTSC